MFCYVNQFATSTETRFRPYTPRETRASDTLFDRVRDAIRVKHYSLRTEQSYLQWVSQFVGYHRRYPAALGEQEVRDFLTHLARDRHVSVSTQNQAFSAILFLFREVLKRELDRLEGVERVQNRERIPLVLSREEVRASSELSVTLRSGLTVRSIRLLRGTITE